MKIPVTPIAPIALVASVAALILAGCVAVAPVTTDTANKPVGVITAHPEPEPTSTVPPSAKAGFVDTSPGAPAVTRAGQRPKSARLGAATVTFGSPAAYPNGISIATARFARGSVSSKGTGIITGSPYIVFEVTLQNGSSNAVDVSQVVVTLKYGAKAEAAAPLYDDVAAADFSGSIATGASRTATYAFQLPKSVTVADLYVDINGDLLPVHFQGVVPND